jgi:hypothetical protein
VHGKLGFTPEHYVLYLTHKQTLAANSGKRTVLDAIARGHDFDQLHREIGPV